MANNSNKKQTSAKINWGWNSSSSRNGGKATRSVKKGAKKAFKKIGVLGIVLIVIFLLIGLAVGIGFNYLVCKNDCFEINSNYNSELGYIWDSNTDTVTVSLDNFKSDNLSDYVYEDIGVKAISLGKDISADVQVVKTNLRSLGDNKYTFDSDITSDNLSVLATKTYYIIYAFPTDLKYGKIATVERIRFVYFDPPSCETDLNAGE